MQLAKQRAAERAKERAEWEALQTQEAAAEAARLRAERDAKRTAFEAAEAKLQQELAERAAVERRILAEKEARLREEREREARCGATYTGHCRPIMVLEDAPRLCGSRKQHVCIAVHHLGHQQVLPVDRAWAALLT